jgi:signal transduction histidine kinase
VSGSSQKGRRGAHHTELVALAVVLVVTGGIYLLIYGLLRGIAFQEYLRGLELQARSASHLLAQPGPVRFGASGVGPLPLEPPVKAAVLREESRAIEFSEGPTYLVEALEALAATRPLGEKAVTRHLGSGSYVLVVEPLARGYFGEAFDTTGWDSAPDTAALALGGLFAIEAVLLAGAAAAVAVSRARERAKVLAIVSRSEEPGSEPGFSESFYVQLIAAVGDLKRRMRAQIDREARIASNLVHELKSHLSALATTAEVLRQRSGDSKEPESALLEVMLEEIDEVTEISRQMLALASARSKDELFLERLDGAELVRSICDQEGVAEAVEVDPSAAGVLVEVDRRALHRILSNLIRNAQTHGRGLTKVSVQCSRGHLIVRVVDEGPGFSGEATSGASDEGGLGLALASTLVTRLGGLLLIDSKQGVGTTVSVLLPIASGPAAPHHGQRS